MLDADAPCLPDPRGTLSAALIEILRRPMHDLTGAPVADDDALEGEDHPLALYLLHELHHRSFWNVDDGWEWEPSLLAIRRGLEREVMGRIVHDVGPPTERRDVAWALDQVSADGPAARVWAWLAEHGTAAQLNELWTVCAATRLPTGPLTALDRPEGPDLARVPGWALAAANIVSCFRLQRRWRGALAGFEAAREQLAAVAAPAAAATIGRLDLGVVDLTSTGPSAPEARRFASRLVRRQPVVASDVVLGGLVARRLDAELARRAIGSWRAGRSLLRPDPLLIHAA